MKSEQYDGTSAAMRKPTPWLASEDLQGQGEVEVVIAGCFHHIGAEFDDGRKEDVYALSFEGKQKQLVLNGTNRKALVRAFGASVKSWFGKRVALFVVKLDRPAFGNTHGIRLKVLGKG